MKIVKCEGFQRYDETKTKSLRRKKDVVRGSRSECEKIQLFKGERCHEKSKEPIGLAARKGERVYLVSVVVGESKVCVAARNGVCGSNVYRSNFSSYSMGVSPALGVDTICGRTVDADILTR